MYNATEVTAKLGISVTTLNRWYGWYKEEGVSLKDTPELPEFIQETKRGPRYWTEEGLDKLIKFKEWLPKNKKLGVMGNYNAKFWGEAGRRALENKKLNESIK